MTVQGREPRAGEPTPSRGAINRRARAWGLPVLLCGMVACGGSQRGAKDPDGATRRDTAIEHEPCDVAGAGAEKIDANGDGRPDVVLVREGEREVCRAVDLNLDGRFDRFTYFDAAGKVRRQESDYDRDGRIDEIAYFQGGVVIERHRATSLNQKLDTWHFYEKGELVRTERDSNGDAIIDQWWEYKTPGCPLIHSDVTNNGRPDPGATIDYCKETGYVPPPRDSAPAPSNLRLEAPVETVTEVATPPVEKSETRDDGGAEEGSPAEKQKGGAP